MQNEYRCPRCKAAIGIDDVNVSTDLALCRSCGKTSSFALISGPAAIDPDILDRPPKHVTVQPDFSDGMVIDYRKRSAALFFLIPFTAFWSGLSMWGIYGQQIRNREFDLAASLFGIPFLLGTIVLVSVIVFMLFGKWRITLRPGEGQVFVGVGALGWTRSFELNRDTVVSMRMTNVSINDVRQTGVMVRNGDSELTFGSLMSEPVKQFITAALLKATGQR